MKKVVISVLCFLSLFVILALPVSVQANNEAIREVTGDAENVINKGAGQLVEIKEKAEKKLQDYKDEYGSDTYGFAAYVLNMIRIYSIPCCFIGIAIGAVYQYVIGIRKLDERDKGFHMIIGFVTILVIAQVLPLIFAIVVKGWRG